MIQWGLNRVIGRLDHYFLLRRGVGLYYDSVGIESSYSEIRSLLLVKEGCGVAL